MRRVLKAEYRSGQISFDECLFSHGSGDRSQVTLMMIEPVCHRLSCLADCLQVSCSLIIRLTQIAQKVTATDNDTQIVEQFMGQHANGVMASTLRLVHVQLLST